MCTVVYLPTGNGYLLSSNRDESPIRPAASEPRIFRNERKSFIAPIDNQAGGTWVGLNSDGESLVLMNGGFKRHEPAQFGKSRGLIVRQLLEKGIGFSILENVMESDVEPFTIVAKYGNVLEQWVWDGNHLHRLSHDPFVPAIWSSSTLYSDPVKQIRTEWFESWLKTNPVFERDSLLGFLTTHRDDAYGFIMNRSNRVRTLSVSILEVGLSDHSFYYSDLLQGTVTTALF